MSTSCFKRVLGAFLVGAAFSLAGSTPAFADNPNITPSAATPFFELDGNVATDHAGTGLPDDWDRVFLNTLAPGTNSVKTFVPDLTPKVFTQGSKDSADISSGSGSWAWRGGSSPPKADIQDAYAVAYNDSNTPSHLITYFGLNRATVNGTTSAGFWFFTEPVCPRSDKTFGQGTINLATGLCDDPSAPPAHHHDGDTLVTVNYTNGGITGNINVFVWKGDQNGSLQAPLSSTNSKNLGGLFCAPGSGTTDPTSTVCGITNATAFDLASNLWTPPSGDKHMAPGQFYEGGIDLFSLSGGQHCFASFMATSRSSATLDSETKNFVLGNFPVCKIDVGKACDTSVANNPSVNSTGTGINTVFKVTITNSGLATVSNVALAEDVTDLNTGSATCKIISITDQNGNTTSGLDIPFTGTSTIIFGGSTVTTTQPLNIVGSLDGGKSASAQVKCASDTNPFINKVFAEATSGSSGSPDLIAVHETNNDANKPPVETCSLKVSPSMDVVKTCNPGTARLLGDGSFTFHVCNVFTITSTTTEQLNNVTVKDKDGTGTTNTIFNNVTLAPSEIKTATHCYDPTAPNVGLTVGQTSVDVLKFMDQITEVQFKGDISQKAVDLVNGAKDENGNTIVLPSAQCPLCPSLTP